jgi:hypothetical protein
MRAAIALSNQKVIKFQPLSPHGDHLSLSLSLSLSSQTKNNKLLGQRETNLIRNQIMFFHHSAEGSDPFNYKTRQKHK